MRYNLALRHKVVLLLVLIMSLLTIAGEAPTCADSAEWVTGDQAAERYIYDSFAEYSLDYNLEETPEVE